MLMGSSTIADQVRLRRSFRRAMHWDRDLPGDLVEQLWRDPHALLAQGQILQDKPRCITLRLDHPQGTFILKHHNWGGPIRSLKRSLGPTRLKPSWIDGRHLHGLGIPTPRPRAYIERRLGPLNVCSYLLTDYIAGTTLYRFMRFSQPSADVVHVLAHQVAAIWQQLDDMGVSHNDLKAENFLIDLTGRLWLIDLEKLCRHRNFDEARRRHAEDAGRLLHPRNWRTNPAAAEIFREHFLQSAAGKKYSAGPGGAAHPLACPAQALNRPAQLLTVLIPCRNDELVIGDCLNSVRDIADEILVADAESTDSTLEIARVHDNCRIIQRTSDDGADFEIRAAKHARHPWILRILPNERVSPDLAIEIQQLLANEPVEDGFKVTRRYYYWGKLLRYGRFRNDSFVRLYRQGKGRLELRNGRIEVVIAGCNSGRLLSKLVCQACWSVRQYLKEALQLAADSADHAPPVPPLRPNLGFVPWRATWQFFQSYVLRFGWLDGWTGLHAACLSAISTYLRTVQRWDQSMPQSQFPGLEDEHAWKNFGPDSVPDLAVFRPAIPGDDQGIAAETVVSTEPGQQPARAAA